MSPDLPSSRAFVTNAFLNPGRLTETELDEIVRSSQGYSDFSSPSHLALYPWGNHDQSGLLGAVARLDDEMVRLQRSARGERLSSKDAPLCRPQGVAGVGEIDRLQKTLDGLGASNGRFSRVRQPRVEAALTVAREKRGRDEFAIANEAREVAKGRRYLAGIFGRSCIADEREAKLDDGPRARRDARVAAFGAAPEPMMTNWDSYVDLVTKAEILALRMGLPDGQLPVESLSSEIAAYQDEPSIEIYLVQYFGTLKEKAALGEVDLNMYPSQQRAQVVALPDDLYEKVTEPQPDPAELLPWRYRTTDVGRTDLASTDNSLGL